MSPWGPTAVDGHHHARHGGRRIPCEKRRKRGHLIDGQESLGRLSLEQHLVDNLLPGDAARFSRTGETRYLDGACIVPPICAQVPAGTYFHDIGSLSIFDWPAQACALPGLAQSFWPALATP